MSAPDPIAERFARETAEHKMTVLHDDGLYRHLRFMRQYWRPPLAKEQRSSMYWFELITVPGSLIFNGDGESYTFRRIEDMFEFFRGPVGRINPGYWGEKVTSSRDLTEYRQEIFKARVIEEFTEAARGPGGVPAGTGRAVREDVLEADIYFERGAREAVESFEHEGFTFYDTFEWDLRDYKWWFLWACHGIVWGIAQYDASRKELVGAAPAAAGGAS